MMEKIIMKNKNNKTCQDCRNLLRTQSVLDYQLTGGYCMERLKKIDFDESKKQNKCKQFIQREDIA